MHKLRTASARIRTSTYIACIYIYIHVYACIHMYMHICIHVYTEDGVSNGKEGVGEGKRGC